MPGTLDVYLTDGRLTIENAPAEQAVRPLCVGRRNWLHLDGDGGQRPTAVLLSVVATVKRHGVHPWAYLRSVRTELPTRPPAADLTPDRWSRSQIGSGLGGEIPMIPGSARPTWHSARLAPMIWFAASRPLPPRRGRLADWVGRVVGQFDRSLTANGGRLADGLVREKASSGSGLKSLSARWTKPDGSNSTAHPSAPANSFSVSAQANSVAEVRSTGSTFAESRRTSGFRPNSRPRWKSSVFVVGQNTAVEV